MKKISLCVLMAVLFAADSGAATSVTRTVSAKSRGGDTESIAQKNRSMRDTGARNTSRSGVDVNKDTNVVSRAGATNSGVVARGGQRGVARAANDQGIGISARNTRTISSNANNVVHRTRIVSRPGADETTGRSVPTDADAENRSVQERALTLSFGTGRRQITPTAESIAAAKDVLEKTADLNNTCQQQYNDCMDQFCAVLDANQKRCSCSENLAKYAKVQQAVEDANAELNEVAQNIRYLGLSADEIHAIMNATEAELELSKAKDSSQTRSMLDDIAEMIKDPTSSTSMSFAGDANSLLEMDFDFSEDSSDLFGLDFFNNSNDISGKRGKDLYREATKRCKTVLNQCKDAGATEAQISGNYDLAISKDCAAYEQGLNNLNQKLLSNVRSANLMLQKGRLSVLQNKNQYDVRGCVAALDNCMMDDMVCGENYLKCLDPTKRYIDENGNVVLGQNITKIIESMQNYNNANINASFIQSAMNDATCVADDGACVVNYLMTKIGTGQSFKDGGLCRAVLDKCQDFTYATNGKSSTYKPYNDVVVTYIKRAMVNIRAAQAQIISDYASSCMSDISDCYNQQISQINSLSATVDIDSVYNVMTGACYNVALTCGYAVLANDPEINEGAQPGVYIQKISDLFYQSLLCPNNSTFNPIKHATISANRTKEGWVNTHCQCNSGYTVWGGACVPSCSDSEYRNTLGGCASCAEGTQPAGGAAGADSANLYLENSACEAQP